jgi:hypothetical protein
LDRPGGKTPEGRFAITESNMQDFKSGALRPLEFDAEVKLPMQVRVTVIAGTTLMLWSGFIAGLKALVPHIVT